MDANASRALQGLITGIGFLGAGVIVKGASEEQVHGLTTAAAIWVAAALGVVCGLGAYLPLVISVVLMALLLGLGATSTMPCTAGGAGRMMPRPNIGRSPTALDSFKFPTMHSRLFIRSTKATTASAPDMPDWVSGRP